MDKAQRPFKPEALHPYVVAEMRPRIGAGSVAVWRFTVFVPVAGIRSDSTTYDIATDDDLENLESLLADTFGGVTLPTIVPVLKGFGAPDPNRPEETRDMNEHTYYTVYAAVHESSDRYFLALRQELEEALAEGVILVERQDVTIL
jgi:hypothetical protein